MTKETPFEFTERILTEVSRERDELRAEIERLRAENQRASDLGLQMSLRISDLSREIERLRAVVEAARKMERWRRDVFGNRLWTEMAIAIDALDAFDRDKAN